MMAALFRQPRSCESGCRSGTRGAERRSRATTQEQGDVNAYVEMRPPLHILVACLLALGSGACSRTWEGVKEDTGENLQTAGQSLEKAGEDIKKQAQ